ncbi:MAG: AAA family ATPase [Ignavibacteriae bacterium]|nr:AAA family ATPase [Ignavibacteriota bacterium]
MNINQQQNTSMKGKAITFYSYKGGVGRSMALVNIACLMVQQKKKVLLIDWDLEAPGLHSYFLDVVKKDDLGLLDFITDLMNFPQSESENSEGGYIDFLSGNIHKYIQKDVPIAKSEFRLDIMKAGKFDDEYTTRLTAINWMEFYRKSPSFFRTFAQYLETEYDYILIDSRTGLSDTGGICTMLMPQILVLVFALSNQNINGVLDVAQQSIPYRFESHDDRELTILPLPSRIDNQNYIALKDWIEKYTEKFQSLMKSSYMLDECKLVNYFNIAKIPYKPEHAYGENIPVLTEDTNNDLFISYHYAQFYRLVENEQPIWEILSPQEIEKNRKLATSHILKGYEYDRESNYASAAVEFEKAAELDMTNNSAFISWGNSLARLAQTKTGNEADSLYFESIEKYQKSLSIKPDFHEAYANWGLVLVYLAQTKTGNEAEVLQKEAFEKYQKALELGGECYNLACWYAAKEIKKEAFFHLELSLQKRRITATYVKDDQDWKNYLQDDDFINLLNKYTKEK